MSDLEGRDAARDRLEHLLRQQVAVVLVRPQQPGNVGAAARAMKNMGLRRLVIVAPPAFDVDRARWMAPGAHDLLDGARYAATVAGAVADCHRVVATTARGRHWQWPSTDPEGLARQIVERAAGPAGSAGPAGAERVAILFGPEDSGLNNDDLSHAHQLLHIPTDAHASLNLSQAVLLVAAAIFSEARRSGYHYLPEASEVMGRRGGPARGAAPTAAPAPSAAELGRVEWLVQEWMSAVGQAGYLMGHEPVLVSSTVRQILQRAGLDEREVIALRGMFKKMRRKMEKTDQKV